MFTGTATSITQSVIMDFWALLMCIWSFGKICQEPLTEPEGCMTISGEEDVSFYSNNLCLAPITSDKGFVTLLQPRGKHMLYSM
jgi:hypothetical protein